MASCSVGPATIHDAERIGDVTTTEVLAKSSNICTAKIAAREGRERLHDMLLRFGFGRRTGVDLPGERAGQLRSAERMGPVETATMAFGQGMTATPLQLAAALRGDRQRRRCWYRPHVMRRVVDPRGRRCRRRSSSGRRVIDAEVAATMRAILHAVTQKGGTARSCRCPAIPFAGKTGTAQKVDPVTRRYSTDELGVVVRRLRAARSIRGMVLFVMIDEPHGHAPRHRRWRGRSGRR